MPSVAAGVIIETPPGGNRGSTAVLVEFLLLEPPVIEAFGVPVTEPDLEPEPEAEALPLLLLLPEVCDGDADADPESEPDALPLCEADVDCACEDESDLPTSAPG